MHFDVEVSEVAAAGLLDVLDYLKQRNWHKAAEKLSNAFSTFLDSISKFPNQYPFATNDLTVRKAVLLQKTIVLYKVMPREIVVVAVFDGRRISAKS